MKKKTYYLNLNKFGEFMAGVLSLALSVGIMLMVFVAMCNDAI